MLSFRNVLLLNCRATKRNVLPRMFVGWFMNPKKGLVKPTVFTTSMCVPNQKKKKNPPATVISRGYHKLRQKSRQRRSKEITNRRASGEHKKPFGFMTSCFRTENVLFTMDWRHERNFLGNLNLWRLSHERK